MLSFWAGKYDIFWVLPASQDHLHVAEFETALVCNWLLAESMNPVFEFTVENA